MSDQDPSKILSIFTFTCGMPDKYGMQLTINGNLHCGDTLDEAGAKLDFVRTLVSRQRDILQLDEIALQIEQEVQLVSDMEEQIEVLSIKGKDSQRGKLSGPDQSRLDQLSNQLVNHRYRAQALSQKLDEQKKKVGIA